MEKARQETLEDRCCRAEQMSGTDSVEKTLARGKLIAREWLGLPLDPDLFVEISQLGHSQNDDLKEHTPADELLSNNSKTPEGALAYQRYV